MHEWRAPDVLRRQRVTQLTVQRLELSLSAFDEREAPLEVLDLPLPELARVADRRFELGFLPAAMFGFVRGLCTIAPLRLRMLGVPGLVYMLLHVYHVRRDDLVSHQALPSILGTMEHAPESILRPYDCIPILLREDLHALKDLHPLLGHWILIVLRMMYAAAAGRVLWPAAGMCVEGCCRHVCGLCQSRGVASLIPFPTGAGP